MHTSETTAKKMHTEGIVRRVDLINRELVLLANGIQVAFDVPPDCPVILNGERVKLRLMQSRDRVRVAFKKVGHLRVACRIDI